MKERPLLYTPENAQKVHVGTKTQTRRIVKWVDCRSESDGSKRRIYVEGDVEEMNCLLKERQRSPLTRFCPYGQVGDRLWCKEAWRLAGDFASVSTKDIPKDKAWLYVDALRYRGEAHSEGVDKWRSGMLMPRWACRTVLEITEIRVERVQDITEMDAKAESAEPQPAEGGTSGWSYRMGFKALWESINGPSSWDANPWVWAITFQKVG